MIFCSDIHARSSKPHSRIDDFLMAQDKKLNFICQEAVKCPPLIIPGDLLHIPKSNPWLEQYLIRLFRYYNLVPLITLGQHDLINHSIDQIDQSSIGVLEAAGVIRILTKERDPYIDTNDGWIVWGCAWGEEPDESMIDNQRKNLLIWHHMVIRGNPLWPGQVADQAEKILRLNPQYQIIATGDNHQFHMTEHNHRILINSGSMMRLTSIQVNHQPTIFKLENEKISTIPLPIQQDVLDLTDLERAKEKDGRISAFVESLDKQYEIGLGYEKNLEEHMRTNRTSPEVQKIVWGCLE